MPMETRSVRLLNIGSTQNEPAELLNAGYSHGKNGDADDRAPDIHPAGLDGGRAQEGAHERGQ